MKHLRQFGLGVFFLFALSVPAVAGNIGCPGDIGQPQTQESPAIAGEMGNPCTAGEIGMPCLAGNIGMPRVAGEMGMPSLNLILSFLF